MIKRFLFAFLIAGMVGASPQQVSAPSLSVGQGILSPTEEPFTAGGDRQESQVPSEIGGSDAVGDLLLQAMGLMGVAYRFGGNSPTQGLDCSGFMVYIFKKSMNIVLPRTAAEMAKIGSKVERDSLQQGDLVFFNTRGFANSHVGMYIGDGKFIHSPRTGKNIEIANLSSKYWAMRYNGARRVEKKRSFIGDYMSPSR
jgi:cell wall-associated NlpC family hydrolase